MSTLSSNSSPYKPFKPAGQGDSRSPCPALNALANHSYLPHDGKDISAFQIARTLREVYKVSAAMAWVLTLGGILLCGNIFRMSLNLHDLAKHNKIEHDGSLAHADTPAGHIYAPIMPDWKILVHSLFGRDAKGGLSDPGADPNPNWKTLGNKDYLVRDDIVRARARLDGELVAPLTGIRVQIARGESAFIVHTLSNANGQIPMEWLRQWMIDERLPEGWSGPQKSIGLLEARDKANQVQADVDKLRSKGAVF